MNRHKFIHILLLAFFAVIITVMVAVLSYASRQFRESYILGKRTELRNLSLLLSRRISAEDMLHKPATLEIICLDAAAEFAVRVTIISTDGGVIFDSEKDAATMENHGTRPEVSAAIAGEVGFDTRFSKERGRMTLYCGVPVRQEGRVFGVVRCSFGLSDIQAGITDFYREMLFIGLVALLLAVGAALFISQRFNRPLQQMRRGAELFAAGDFRQRIPSSGIEELALTIDTLNHMAAELASRIATVERQKTEKEKILSSMSEGVLALDGEDRILYLNNAMVRIFGLNREGSIGRFLHEVIRVPEIQRLVSARMHAGEEGIDEHITFTSPTEKHMQAHAVPLPANGSGKGPGALLVFNDITQLCRLERTRQDFVANVSHELRTPITSIMGFVETLLEGAAKNPEKAARFLGIIKAQTSRMVAIIDDLLLLSRLDSGTELPQELIDAHTLLSCANNACAAAAERKGIRVELKSSPGIKLRGSGNLLEQALVNLLNNAVSYSPEDTTVRMSVISTDDETIISVADQGCGISSTNLPRIFERFFRVDKARTPQAGGTGLGLSIVTHLALIHHGRVEVESQLGTGSTFRLILPREN